MKNGGNKKRDESKQHARIGVFGGSFDPIHVGHLVIAQEARWQCELDMVLFVITAHPPHKQEPEASGLDRLKMVELAIGDEEGFEVSRIEIERGGRSYTSETLKELHQLYPTSSFYLIVGADSALDFSTWKTPEAVIELANVVVAPRPGFDLSEISPALKGKTRVFQVPTLALSSTMIRQRRREGKPIRFLVPKKWNSIYTTEVYTRPRFNSMTKGKSALHGYLETARQYAEENLSGELLEHTRGCVETARALARRFNVDAHKAMTASYLHDIAKIYSHEEQAALAGKMNVSAVEIHSCPRAVLHGSLGAAIAEQELGINDPDILQAIRAHSTGCAAMCNVAKVVFVADYIEHTRNFPGATELRNRGDLGNVSLDTLTTAVLKRKLEHLLEERKDIDLRAIALWNEQVKISD